MSSLLRMNWVTCLKVYRDEGDERDKVGKIPFIPFIPIIQNLRINTTPAAISTIPAMRAGLTSFIGTPSNPK